MNAGTARPTQKEEKSLKLFYDRFYDLYDEILSDNFISLAEFYSFFAETYSRDLCYPKVAQVWSQDNPSWGMCAITALVINDYFGGDIYKIKTNDESHYFNVINGNIVDLTVQQFGHPIKYKNKVKVKREDMLKDQNTEKRYQKLKTEIAYKIDNYS